MKPRLALPSAETVSAYRAALVPWYRENARDLPWRRDRSPYRIWVSEIMLQQTRVETVVPFYERFLTRFPDLRALAGAREEEVLEAWSGLGYYRRARMLHAGARQVVERHGGEFPENASDVLALPGIGRYTAGAIRSIALGARAPILDGNVTRVLARGFGIRGDVSKSRVSSTLWEIAEAVVAHGEPGEVNQAQMELGALVCAPAVPDCSRCPVRQMCVARREDLIDALPELPKRRETVSVRRVVLLVRSGSDVLLRRRTESELLSGLWDLPGAFTGVGGNRSTGVEEAMALLPFRVRPGGRLGRMKHAITYRRIELDIREAHFAARRRPARSLTAADGAALQWRAVDEALGRALSSPARHILRRWGIAAARPSRRALHEAGA